MRSEVEARPGTGAFLALAVSILLNVAALLLLRALVDAIAPAADAVTIRFFADALASWLLWAGVAAFVAGMYFWIQSLKAIPLSVAYPSVATSYVVIALFSRYLFDEPITGSRAVGMVLIIAGVTLLYRRVPEPAA